MTIQEFDFGGVPLTDNWSADLISLLVGKEAFYAGRRGTIEAIWLKEGTVPWPGPPWPRPLYRVHWSPSDG